MPNGSRRAQVLTLLLLTLASLAAEWAVVDSRWDYLNSVLLVVAAIVVGGLVNRRIAPRGVDAADSAKLAAPLPPAAIGILFVLFVLPFGFELAQYPFKRGSAPMEVLLVSMLRSLGFGLAMLSRWPSCLRLAALLSLFLLMAGVILGEGVWPLVIAAAYATLGSVWLMIGYWDGLVLQSSLGLRGRFPFSAAIAVFLVIGTIAATAAVGPRRAGHILFELLPSSGGTGDYNPFSRGGVNDGDEEMRGSKDANSVGFAESDIFKDTPDQSLYDIPTDFFGEPMKPKEQDRAIALNVKPRESDDPVAVNPRAGREFPTVRREPKERRRPKDRAADALLYVKGVAPAHLRMVVYDRFDGSTWYEAEQTIATPDLESDGTPWMRFREPPKAAYLADTVSHEIKVGLLRSDRVAAPALLRQFRVGKIDAPGFYRLAQEGVIKVETARIPSTTKIETEAWTVCPERLREVNIPQLSLTSLASTVRCPEARYFDPRIAELAQTWTADLPRGWQQVETLVARLREYCVHDPAARAPEECIDVIGYFLFEARRGPDYLFASAAAMMLRTLGYSTRVVSGFYLNPDHYESSTDHTLVMTEDYHFWAEVEMPGRIWVPIEPTPGYETVATAIPWSERLWRATLAAWHWFLAHWIPVSLALVMLAVLWVKRGSLADRVATLAWRVRAAADPRQRVRQTLRLVDRRARLAGHARPQGQTHTRWLAGLAPATDGAVPTAALAQWAAWACYAPESSLGIPPDIDFGQLCAGAEQHWTLQRFRQMAKAAKLQTRRSLTA